MNFYYFLNQHLQHCYYAIILRFLKSGEIKSYVNNLKKNIFKNQNEEITVF